MSIVWEDANELASLLTVTETISQHPTHFSLHITPAVPKIPSKTQNKKYSPRETVGFMGVFSFYAGFVMCQIGYYKLF